MTSGPMFFQAIGLGFLVLSCGCASVISGRHADVAFYSSTPNASVVIHDKHGNEVANTMTPATVALKRKDRIIFPAKYTATFSAPGYQSVAVPIGAKVNPWVFGNVAFLQIGLVGLAVDNATGAAWAPKQSTYYQELTPILNAQNGQPAAATTPVQYMATLPSPRTGGPYSPRVPPSATAPVVLPATSAYPPSAQPAAW
jgi:hypothetical protein